MILSVSEMVADDTITDITFYFMSNVCITMKWIIRDIPTDCSGYKKLRANGKKSDTERPQFFTASFFAS